ncbi:unnamed protein product [Schistosoma mattheei]|uniref:Uncharacterized protein n=1 Tax=Schistosoma mattheei TaxID=31246 RepID=A0A183P095_9TREM|nr:unnamed protein product [Schistosoma mattheei]
MVGGSRQDTLDLEFVLFGTRPQGVPLIFRKLIVPDGIDPVSPNVAVRDVITKLSGPRLTSCRAKIFHPINQSTSRCTEQVVKRIWRNSNTSLPSEVCADDVVQKNDESSMVKPSSSENKTPSEYDNCLHNCNAMQYKMYFLLNDLY